MIGHMNYYDFHVRSDFSEGESSIGEIAERSKLLGFNGICFAENFENEKQIEELRKEISDISKKIGINIFLGFEARNKFELRKLVNIRRKYDVLLVNGLDLDLSIKAVETPEVDILTHPGLGKKDSGFNHVMAKLASKNNVTIEVNFREILSSSKNTRSHIIHNIAKNVELCKKFKAPLIICSGAISHWQLKDPKVLISMGCLLGLELNEAKKSLSEVPEKIIGMIRERQNKEWVRPGVKVVK